MARLYFVHCDGDRLYPDEDGAEFETPEKARDEAARALGEAARDALPGIERGELSIDAYDENRRPLFRTALRFEVQPLTAG